MPARREGSTRHIGGRRPKASEERRAGKRRALGGLRIGAKASSDKQQRRVCSPSLSGPSARSVTTVQVRMESAPHRDTFTKHNLLTRGQEVMVEVDHSRRRIITLRPGEMSLHHVRLVHGSPPTTDASALSPAISRLTWRSSPARIVPSVRGEDRHRHFIPAPQPRRDLDLEFVALHPPSPSAARGSSIAARTSRARTSRRRWRRAAEPARGGVGVQSSRLHLYSDCAILSSDNMSF
jgi:hypothetical protein